jgi:flagellar hook-associated protein 3 FlgL
MSYSRVSSYNTYDSAIRNLQTRLSNLSTLQEHITAGKRVVRPSDDPTAAAQAERAQMRMARVTTEQRALSAQRNSMEMAESTLGNATDVLQTFREKVVSAGNGTYSATERNALLQELQSLRDQLFSYSNKTDGSGQPLFSGLNSTATPFVDATTGTQYLATPGQKPSGEVSVSPTLDGQAAWMSVPTGNGVFAINYASTNTGGAWTDLGQVTNPSALTGDPYSITFTVDPTTKATTYTVTNTTTGLPANDSTTGTPLTNVAYTAGKAIQFDGMSIIASGAPANGDSFSVANSTTTDVFSVMDKAIADIRNAGANSGTNTTSNTLTGNLAHGIAQALTQIDSGMTRIESSRGYAGDLLNRVDRIDSLQQTRAVQLESDRSRAEDIDMVQGLSDLATQQTAYSAALQSYAQIQKLSLFNYIS